MQIEDNLPFNREKFINWTFHYFFLKISSLMKNLFPFFLKVESKKKLCNFQVTFYKLYEITSS